MPLTVEENYTAQHTRCSALEGANRFNNYVKALLIKQHMPYNGQVLDMPCGKGGDIKKFRARSTAFYMGIDLVPSSIDEARKRHISTKCMFGAVFDVGDFTLPLELKSKYDLVSCQFAMHYAWDRPERARQVPFLAYMSTPYGCRHMVYTLDDVKKLEALNIQIIRELEQSHANIEADCMSYLDAKKKAATMEVYFDMSQKLEACTDQYARFFHEMEALKKRAAGLI